MSNQADLYEVLGVSRRGTEEEIRRAYRRLAMEWHPDRNKSKDAEGRFKQINEAYQILIDPQKRDLYDRYGQVDFQSAANNSGRGFDGVDISGGFGDIFDSFFGGFGARAENGPRRGADLHYKLDLSFQEAVFGITEEVQVERTEACSICNGTRCSPGTSSIKCNNCNGSGQVRRAQSGFFGQFVQIVTCSACRGEGQVVEKPCADCKGSGREKKKRTLKVEIPAGVDDGMQVRLSGEGNKGAKGGTPGDVYITLEVHSHPLFQRKGQDLILDMPVNFGQAALGDKIDLPQLDGTSEEVKIPAGIQSGTVLRIKGKGVPKSLYINNGKNGDLLVKIQVITPQHPNIKTRKILEDLSRILEEEALSSNDSNKSWLNKMRDVLSGDSKK